MNNQIIKHRFTTAEDGLKFIRTGDLSLTVPIYEMVDGKIRQTETYKNGRCTNLLYATENET